MKKFKGLIIPENLITGNNDDCCNHAYEDGDCAYIKCNVCLLNYPDKFNLWIKLNRPCEICEDEE